VTIAEICGLSTRQNSLFPSIADELASFVHESLTKWFWCLFSASPVYQVNIGKDIGQYENMMMLLMWYQSASVDFDRNMK